MTKLQRPMFAVPFLQISPARRGLGREGEAGLLLSGLEIWASGGTVVCCWAWHILGLNMGMTSNR